MSEDKKTSDWDEEFVVPDSGRNVEIYPQRVTPVKEEGIPKEYTISFQDAPKLYASVSSPKRKKAKFEAAPVARVFVPTIINDEDVVYPKTVQDREDLAIAIEGIELYRVDVKTIVAAIAVDLEDNDFNIGTAIRCHGGIAFGGYPYDQHQDSYIIRCCDWFQVGAFAIGYRMTMKGIGDWKINIPVPARILEKCFNALQCQSLDCFKQKYPEPRYSIHYIQMCGSN